METYKSDKVTINHNINLIYSKLSDPSIFKAQIDNNMDRLPDEAREHLKSVKFEEDGISVSESQEPTMVKYTAQSSPVPFGVTINLESVDENTTQAVTELNIELPFMLKAMVGGKLSEGAQKMGELIAKLPYGEM